MDFLENMQLPTREESVALTATERSWLRRSLTQRSPALESNAQSSFKQPKRNRMMTSRFNNAKEYFKEHWDSDLYGSVCDVCDRIMYKRSLKRVKEEHIHILESAGFDRDIRAFRCCDTCYKTINVGRIPAISTTNGFSYPPRPSYLPELDPISARLISPRIPFVAIRRLRKNGQFGIVGQVVNVPVDVNAMINTLPRNLDDDYAINVSIKRKLIHKSSYLKGHVRIQVLKQWLDYLVETPLYRRDNITIDWSNYNQQGERFVPDAELIEPLDQNASEAVHLSARQQTLLWNESYVLDIAPGQNNQPLNITYDPFAEELSFPEIYFGVGRYFKPGVRVTPYMIANSEISRSDRRGVTPAKILYTAMKILRARVVDSIYSTFRCIPETEDITKRMLEDRQFMEDCVQQDFAFLKTLPNSAQYWLSRKKDLFAMIRQLGKPTCFLTLSANETKWPDLLKVLLKFNEKFKNADINDPLAQLNASQRSELVNEDPVICCTHFHKVLFTLLRMLKSRANYNPLGRYRVKDYFLRIEFQHRGSPHAHILLWLENDPSEKVSEHMPKTIQLITDICSVSAEDLPETYDNQVHKHTFTCTKRGEETCRFNIPYWPAKVTMILKPLSSTTDGRKNAYAKKAKMLKQSLSIKSYGSIDLFLEENRMNYNQYLDIIRSSLKRPTIIFKREMSEIYTNTFNPGIASILNSNMDLQFILDEYSCASYVVDYVNKSYRGISNLHRELSKLRAENPEMNDSDLIRKLGSRILNTVELSAQEAAWFLLRFHMSDSSRETVYIPTCWPIERQKARKHKSALDRLDDDSIDIWSDSIIQKYEKRPAGLGPLCLAEFAAWYTKRKRNTKVAENHHLEHPDLQTENSSQIEGNPNKNATDSRENNEENDRHSRDGCINEAEYAAITGDRNYTAVDDMLDYYRRRHSRIIRFRNYDKTDTVNYKREMVTLFVPFRNESLDIIDRHKFLKTFDDEINTINRRRLDFEMYSNFEELMQEYKELNELGDEQVSRHAESFREQFVRNLLTGGQEENFDDFDDGPTSQKNSVIHCVRKRTNVLSKEEFCSRMAMTNEDQRELILEIIHRIHSFNENPLQIFLTGPAGSGKTFLLKLIMETYNRYSQCQNDLNNSFVACASTGKAAVNLGGTTVHSAFHLSTSRRSNALARETLQSYRNLFSNVKCIIIDEVSMISSNTFHDVNSRLQDITGEIEPFGSMNIIFCGDFKQLPPVMGAPIFKGCRSHLQGSLLWSSLDFFPLTRVMRQSDVAFSTLLTKIGEGMPLLSEESSMIESRFRDYEWCEANLAGVVRLFHTNRRVDQYNLTNLEKAEDKVNSQATDLITGYSSSDDLNNARSKLHRMKTTETGNLPYLVILAVGYPYLITTNLDVADGLVNGTYGILRLVERQPEQDSSHPLLRLWFSFPEKLTGVNARRKSRSNNSNGGFINPEWTPISLRTVNIKIIDKIICRRTQFPVVPACAMTIHKSQGGTFEKVVFVYDKSQLVSLVYVALSRVTSLEGLYIVNDEKDHVFHHKRGCSSPTISEVLCEYQRLANHRLRTITTDMKLLLKEAVKDGHMIFCTINAQSLIAHVKDIETDKLIMRADVLLFNETWMADSDLSINQFDFISGQYSINERDLNGNRRTAGGVAIYKRKEFDLGFLGTDFDLRISAGRRVGDVCLTVLENDNADNIVVCSIYIHPNQSKENLKRFLNTELGASSVLGCRKLLVSGDFNVDITGDDWLLCFMRDHLKLDHVDLSAPTTLGNTKIDLTFVRGLDAKCTPYVSYFSYHRPMFIIVKANK